MVFRCYFSWIAATDVSTHYATWSHRTTLIQDVFVSEVVYMPIHDDVRVNPSEAVRIRNESREFGLKAFPDVLDRTKP